MKERFKSALDRVEADEALVSTTEAHLRNALAQGKHSRTKLMTGRIYEMKKFAIAACMALMLIGGGFAYATPTSYLSVDINPSVELGINTFGQVVSAAAFNKDGEDILSGIDVKGKKVKEAVGTIVDAAVDKGYFEKDGTSIVSLTAVTDHKEKADKLIKDAGEGADGALGKNDQTAEVLQDVMALARRDAARELADELDIAISPGKLNLIQKLWEAENPEEVLTAENYDEVMDFAEKKFAVTGKTYAESSVKDIMAAIKGIPTDADNDSDGDATVTHGNSGTPPGQLKKGTGEQVDQNSILSNGKSKVKNNATAGTDE